ncbi:MAG: hypothetical protein ABSA27_08215 [Terriglobales bacterium]|jgi:hypothetical protein
MLTMRPEQVEAFRQYHLQKFEDEMVEHLKKFAPQRCKVAGEAAVREVIRIGIENAKKYGLTNRGPVRFYIELMFAFGSYFDTDPQYPWAGTVLSNPEQLDQMVRADRLWNQAREYLAEVSGPKHEHMQAALQRLKESRPEDFIRPGEPLDESLLLTLPGIFPQRCDYLGETALRDLVRKGLDLAHSYEFETDTGKVVVVALALAVGHRFADDPLWGWAKRRMDTSRFPDPEIREEKLHSAAKIYLEHALAADRLSQ